MPEEKSTKEDLLAVEKLREARDRIKKEIRKVIIGQDQVIDELLIALLSNGHCLLIGVPGLSQDPSDQHHLQGSGLEIQPYPVHS